jgi:hypothetical protein
MISTLVSSPARISTSVLNIAFWPGTIISSRYTPGLNSDRRNLPLSADVAHRAVPARQARTPEA